MPRQTLSAGSGLGELGSGSGERQLLGDMPADERALLFRLLDHSGHEELMVLLGLMLLLAAASVAGLPPLPGFLGKVMLLKAAWVSPWQPWVWTVVLLVGFMSLVALARAGSLLFWNVRPELSSASSGASPQLVIPTLGLLMLGVVMSVSAAPLKRYTEAMAHQLLDRPAYARAVLGVDEATGQPPVTVRPYRMPAPSALPQEVQP